MKINNRYFGTSSIGRYKPFIFTERGRGWDILLQAERHDMAEVCRDGRVTSNNFVCSLRSYSVIPVEE
jgi:hypothetical protein